MNNKVEIAKQNFLNLLKTENYKLVSDISEYNGVMYKIKVQCPEGHIYEVKPNNFKTGSRCPKCSNRCPEQAKHKFLILLKQEKYKLLSDYGTKDVKIECPKGHIYNSSPKRFRLGNRCPKCSNNCSEQATEQFLKLIKQEGYKLLSKYKNSDNNVLLECPKGHKWETKPHWFKNCGNRCPKCQGSTGQRLLAKLIEQELSIKPEENVKGLLKGRLELDLYFPSMNVAIEYQGNYWHSLPENKIRDKRKRKLCEELGIHLIEVWDNDFMNNQEETLKRIINKIKKML